MGERNMREDGAVEAAELPEESPEDGGDDSKAEAERAEKTLKSMNAHMLQTIHSLRRRLTDEQVNWVREQVLLEHTAVSEICAKLYPQMRPTSIWNLVRGRTYANVPLSRRLKLAYHRSVAKRQVPQDETSTSEKDIA